ncbi:hypothetical protein [Hoylesella enoeca]|uniref:hypothetical protein n=1 Tax=Hoylesella enoeca TaxID=76123 RepID=UPI002889F240|nr:hypothetical protein [Hoylesella enoeca]
MKKLFTLAFALILSVTGSAKQEASVSGMTFGMDYTQAVQQIEAQFGKPAIATEQQLTYNDAQFMGIRFHQVNFKFGQNKSGNIVLNEARFTVLSKDKHSAQRFTQLIAKKMEADYPDLSMDIEDDGAPFYKGGSSPVDNSRLFTIYQFRQNGKYASVLRFGPIRF